MDSLKLSRRTLLFEEGTEKAQETSKMISYTSKFAAEENSGFRSPLKRPRTMMDIDEGSEEDMPGSKEVGNSTSANENE